MITIAAILTVATTIGKALAVAGLAVEGLKALGNAFVALGKALGLIKPETNVEDLGDKAIQAEQAGIKSENFSSYEEYMKKVEEFETDPEKSKTISESEKLAKGIEVTASLTAEKYPDFPVEAFTKYAISNPQYFTADRMTEFGKLLKGSVDMAKTVFGYITGSERNTEKMSAAREALTKIEKTINPNISDADALKNVLSSRK